MSAPRTAQKAADAWEQVRSLCFGFILYVRAVRSLRGLHWEARVLAAQLVLVARLKSLEDEISVKHPYHSMFIGQLRIVVEALTIDAEMGRRLLGHVKTFHAAAFRKVPA